MSKVYLASDHAGFALKQELAARLIQRGYTIEDCGDFEAVAGDDYPDFITPCAKKVAAEEGNFGIIIGASGQGEAMCANRIHGARAAVYYGEAVRTQEDAMGMHLGIIASERVHNDANILSLGARFVTTEEATRAVEQFLTTPFSGDARHVRRLAKF